MRKSSNSGAVDDAEEAPASVETPGADRLADAAELFVDDARDAFARDDGASCRLASWKNYLLCPTVIETAP